jgi:hypothetical protein
MTEKEIDQRRRDGGVTTETTVVDGNDEVATAAVRMAPSRGSGLAETEETFSPIRAPQVGGASGRR